MVAVQQKGERKQHFSTKDGGHGATQLSHMLRFTLGNAELQQRYPWETFCLVNVSFATSSNRRLHFNQTAVGVLSL